MALQNNTFSFNGWFISDVLDIDFENRKLAVYIPKLMPALSGDSLVETEIPTSTTNNISGLVFNQTVKIRNSMWVEPFDYKEPLPKIGSKVSVRFIDSNPKRSYWSLFNPNNDYEVIDEEKFPKIFDFKIGNKTIQINSEDSVTIEFPENFITVLNQEDKNKTFRLYKQESYIISSTQPEEPFEGLMWYNLENSTASIYKEDEFKKIIFEENLTYLYDEVERLSNQLLQSTNTSRLIFATNINAIAEPYQDQIVVIDSSRTGTGFYTYTQLDSLVTLQNEGFYYKDYEYKVVEYFAGVETELKAYKYNGISWEKLDGWFPWTQPITLGFLDSAHPHTGGVDDYLEWDYSATETLLITEIYFEGISISTDTSVTFQFYTGTDTNIGAQFTLINTGGTYTLSPDYYQNNNLNGDNLYVPDIGRFGIEASTLKCLITSDDSSTIQFGTVTIGARSDTKGV